MSQSQSQSSQNSETRTFMVIHTQNVNESLENLVIGLAQTLAKKYGFDAQEAIEFLGVDGVCLTKMTPAQKLAKKARDLEEKARVALEKEAQDAPSKLEEARRKAYKNVENE